MEDTTIDAVFSRLSGFQGVLLCRISDGGLIKSSFPSDEIAIHHATIARSLALTSLKWNPSIGREKQDGKSVTEKGASLIRVDAGDFEMAIKIEGELLLVSVYGKKEVEELPTQHEEKLDFLCEEMKKLNDLITMEMLECPEVMHTRKYMDHFNLGYVANYDPPRYEGDKHMTEWLRRMGLEKHIPKFLKEQIDMETFSMLTGDDFLKMGIDDLEDWIKLERAVQGTRSLGPPLCKILANITISEKVNDSQYGELYKGVTAEGSAVALKKFNNTSITRRLEMAIENLAKIPEHNNIQKVLGLFVDNNEGGRYLVTNWLAGVQIKQFISLKRAKNIDDDLLDLISIAKDICKGLAHLHTRNPPIIHGNLCLNNVLLEWTRNQGKLQTVAKLSDYSLHAPGLFEGGRESYNRYFGYINRRWAPPENIEDLRKISWTAGPGGYSFVKKTTKSDIWALGITLCELFNGGAIPFANIPDESLLQLLKDNPIPQLPIYTEIKDIVKKCFEIEPNKRPTATEVLQMFN